MTCERRGCDQLAGRADASAARQNLAVQLKLVSGVEGGKNIPMAAAAVPGERRDGLSRDAARWWRSRRWRVVGGGLLVALVPSATWINLM